MPLIGVTKLNKLTLPAVRAFQDRLRESGRSPELTRKVLTSLGSLVADAQERRLTTRNPVRERKRHSKATARHKKRLVVGVDIPTPKEIRTLLNASVGRWRAFVATAALAGLRLSELRGLAWADVDFVGPPSPSVSAPMPGESLVARKLPQVAAPSPSRNSSSTR